MIAWIVTTLVLLVSMTMGVGLAVAHDNALKPNAISETMNTLPDADADGDAAELEGTLEILHEDLKDGTSVDHHFLSTHDGRRFSLEGVRHPDLLTGDVVRVKGVTSGRHLRLQTNGAERQLDTNSGGAQLQTKSAENLQVLQYASLSNTFGEQNVVVLLVNFSNDQSRPFTVSDMRYWMTFTDDFYRVNSYGQTGLSVDVFGWYTLPVTNAGCPSSTIASKADQAATAAGVKLSTYARRIYVFPDVPGCAWSGLGSIGGNPSSAWINGVGSLSTINHELGHNFGLSHSHSMSCGGASLGPNCTTSDYGDFTDTMGGGGGPFNAFQKERLGWLGYGASPPITNVTTSGTYSLNDNESPGMTAKALKIQRETTSQAFFVELHTPAPGRIAVGVFVHLASGSNGYLLDMTPATPTYPTSNLAVGQSFTDPVSLITITTVSESATGATVRVDMGDAGPSCIRSAPTVTATPGQSLAVQSGTMVTYDVSVTNTDSAACSASTFALAATAPTTNWLKSFGASSVTAGPGASASTTLQITSPAVPTGSYAIVGAATRTTSSPPSGSGSMYYNVVPGGPVPPTGPTFTDIFDRPDSPVLGNGWSVISGSLMLQSGEARNQAGSTFSLAVQPGSIGATQTVATSFASTNNNDGPRFGVVVRYRDSSNYYMCYRQVGGSSVLRIAKMQNGVETVLKSVGIGNPTLKVLSKISCQASGSTLTLFIDGVMKVSMSDGTFGTGSAGFMISAKVGSHRADNFSAMVQ